MVLGLWRNSPQIDLSKNVPVSLRILLSHFDCNYGNQQIPWDWVFGSYASKPADLKKIWGRDKPTGPENDTTKKHASSLSKFMVQ